MRRSLHPLFGTAFAAALAASCATTALALGKPDWAKPYLTSPSPSGPYIAQNDTWVVVYGEVEFALRGERSIEIRSRLILENMSAGDEEFVAELSYDEGAQDMSNLSLNVQRTLWHEINLAKKAIRASVATGPQVLYASAERIQSHKRVVLEYTVADRLGVTPWAAAYVFRGEPVCRMRYSVDRDSAARGLQLHLVSPAGGGSPAGFVQEPDGAWTVASVPAYARLRTSRLVYQPALDDLYPYFLVSAAAGEGKSFHEYAAFYRLLWDKRAGEIGAGEVKDRAENLTRGASSVREKVVRLARFVQHEIQYDGSRATSVDSWLPIVTQETLRSMKADCKGKTMLAQALLRAVGIDSVPVLLRSESVYFTWGEAVGTAFINHVILAVSMPRESGSYPATLREGPAKGFVLFDPTVETADFGEPLPGFEGVPALFVADVPNPVFEIHTERPSVAQAQVDVRLDLDEAGVLHGTVRAVDNGYSGLVAGLAPNWSEDEIRRSLVEALAEHVPGVRMQECSRRKAGEGPGGAADLEFAFESAKPLQRMSNESLLVSPLAVASVVAGLPRGFAAGIPPKSEDAARLDPPWDTKLNTTGFHAALRVTFTLSLPPKLAFVPPNPRHEAHRWLTCDLAWSPDGPRRWKGELRLEMARGNWPREERKERVVLMDALYTDLYSPLLVEPAGAP